MLQDDPLEVWRARWRLTADGAAFVTPHSKSHLQPVRAADGRRAMLKLAVGDEEIRGNGVMVWWAGRAAAEVLAHEGDTLLLDRLDGPRSLIAMSCDGEDDRATEILCETALRLHRDAADAPPLPDISRWFAALRRQAGEPGADQALFADAWARARALIGKSAPVVLHGDLHHGNVLQGARGWQAIDPKGVIGDPGYDFANLLNNPEPGVAHAPGRLGRQARVVATCTGRPLETVLAWGMAYAALSAAWSLGDGHRTNAALALTTARLAQAELAALA